MRAVLLLLFVAACTVQSVQDDQAPVNDDTPETGEIDGTYLDTFHGVCVGGVGGAVRCSGSVCDPLDQATCAATAGCYVALQDDGSFRHCLPIDARQSTAGACASLTVYQCAAREDCASVFMGQSIFAAFVRCDDE
jgi:hypothetical protein